MTERRILLVLGLGFGDEGKGSIVDYLTRGYGAHTIVRFNGGSQAAHHVITSDGIAHCFSQFGSGTLVPGVETFLSQHMLIDPLGIILESNVLKEKGVGDACQRLIIDGDCVVITPFHKIINRILEVSRGDSKHGSCGMGVGEAAKDQKELGKRMLFASDLAHPAVMGEKLKFIQQLKIAKAEVLVKNSSSPELPALYQYLDQLKRQDYVELLVGAYLEFAVKKGVRISDRNHLLRILAKKGTVIFEGAQGALLDATHGFFPHVTATCTTFRNAEDLIPAFYRHRSIVKRLGVLRAYSTRHGAGPFITEDESLTKQIPDLGNGKNPWQDGLRVGWFDMIAAKYALKMVGGVDCIALTNLDRLYDMDVQVCTGYKFCNSSPVNPKGGFEKFFELKGKQEQDSPEQDSPIKIKGIRLIERTTDEHQKKLTALLKQCRPLNQSGWHIKSAASQYIQFLEKELRTPIALLSFGPTANDKFLMKGEGDLS